MSEREPLDDTKRYELKPKKDRWVYIVAALVLLVAAGFLYWQSVQNEAERDAAQRNAQTANEKVETGQDFALRVLETCRVEKSTGPLHRAGLCADAPSVAKGIKGDTGPQGPAGPPPSASEIALAVQSYCAGGRCDGQAPTPAQVSAAVTRYCNARLDCVGPAGPVGATGPAGQDGKDGADGQDAFPFSFSFTVGNGVGHSSTYTVRCGSPGACSVSQS